MSSTCYLMKAINKVLHGIAHNYKPSLVTEQFKKIAQISREGAGKSKSKTNQVSKIKIVTNYNRMLPKIDGIIKKKKKKFQLYTVIYKRNKNLKELIASSIYPK